MNSSTRKTTAPGGDGPELRLADLALPGRHQPCFADHGMVATSQPLAAAAGLRVLQDGGTAVDAAIAMAACLTVVEPCSNGVGADAFALVWDGQRLHGLNGSGRAPAAVTARRLRDAGHARVPLRGWESVTVPGAPRAWADLHGRFGRLPFPRLLEPAARYAEEGFPVSPVVAWGWQAGVAAHSGLAGEEFGEFRRVFAPAPAVGERRRLPDHAATLRELGATRGASLYDGALAERLAAHAAATGGYLTAADLAAHRSEWVAPISTSYRGHEVWEIPPNAQGIAALLALNILEGFDLAALPPVSAEAFHLGIEAVKLALVDTHRHVADPAHAEVPTADLLSTDYAARRRRLIGGTAHEPAPADPRASDTVYLCAADGAGMMVSLIQSTFHGFGSHVVVPGTGIALQNRGHGFALEPGHPNELAPGKRPFHTIIPGFLTREGSPVGPFGVMGGHMQAQGHVQLIVGTVDHRLDPQSALDLPRWYWSEGRSVLVESAAGPEVRHGLAARGHAVAAAPHAGPFGRGQVIWRLRNGVLVGASDPRADGTALGW